MNLEDGRTRGLEKHERLFQAHFAELRIECCMKRSLQNLGRLVRMRNLRF